MATGISGTTPDPTVGGVIYQNQQIVELRTISNLLQNLLGSDQAIDEIPMLRNDNAFALGITLPQSTTQD